jgi:hypothetical protein
LLNIQSDNEQAIDQTEKTLVSQRLRLTYLIDSTKSMNSESDDQTDIENNKAMGPSILSSEVGSSTDAE